MRHTIDSQDSDTIPVTRQGQTDLLLKEICRALQITQTQFEDAERSYRAIGDWLEADGSPLRPYHPAIYPQGSMLLGTTVRPRKREEYDLDIVCQLHACDQHGPMAVFAMVHNRLLANGTYKKLVEPKKRCIRLNYDGNFHLDILPACPDLRRGNTCLIVPDRELHAWTPSNPKGFARWFQERAEQKRSLLLEKAVPIPDNVPAHQKSVLQRCVQLLKRHRDMVFDGAENAPRSVILTTLAAIFYNGQPSLIESLVSIVDSIISAIAATKGILDVRNPTNPDEHFSDSWTPESYQAFVQYMITIREHLEHLTQSVGIPRVHEHLATMFGPSYANRALEAYTERFETARENSTLRTTKNGSLTTLASTAVSTAVPRNTFFGS